MRTLDKTAEWKGIISKETTDMWLSRIAKPIPTNVKMMLASRHPLPPDESKELPQSDTTDAGVLV
jgi:hypothetical protein